MARGHAAVYGSPDDVNLTTMKATSRELEIVTRNGKPVSVIIPIKDYKELLERAEDAEDIAWLKRARRKKLLYRPLEAYSVVQSRFGMRCENETNRQ